METIPDIYTSFENAACGLLTADASGKIHRVNATFCRWLGYSRDELLEKKVQELFTVGGRFFHHTHWAPLLQMQGSVAEILMDVVCSDKTALPMLINAVRSKHGETYFDQVSFFIATDRKSYERELILTRQSAESSLASLKETQQALRESRDVLKIAMHSARLGVWSQDLISKAVWWSNELEQLVGLSEGMFAGTMDAFHQLIHEEDRPFVVLELQNAVLHRLEYVAEFRLRHSRGEWMTVEGRGHAIYSEKGVALSIIGVVIDISERKITEEKLRSLNDQLSRSDRRKDEFLATLAHELRNPLAPLRNVIEIMHEKKNVDPFLQWSRDVIERQVTQMTHLVDDLMEISRISQGRLTLRKQQVDVTDVMQHAVESATALMRQFNHTLSIEWPKSQLLVDADLTRMIQIISNLLTNAVKYTPAGGQIFLAADRDGSDVVITVRDTGIGIPAQELSNIFSMFSQLTPALERSQGGLGIGLALVKGLVELHSGSISAFSNGEGKGSEFVVRLPLAEMLPEAKSQERSAESESQQKTFRILVVDDNVDAADSLVMLLEINGHDVRSANDGNTGISLAESFKPDLILLDIGLPDINGYDVARQLRSSEWGKDIFFIAATGWGQSKDKERAENAGFNEHLTKPIDFKKLNSILASL